MEKLTIEQIKELQKTYGVDELQNLIDTGQAWKREGSVGRAAMSALEQGACMLGVEAHDDTYGNRVPSRTDVMAGTKGTFENSQYFWGKVESGEIELEEE